MFFRNSENLGRTATRDLLAKKARYNTLLFLDADVLPAQSDFIKKYLSAIGKSKVVFGGVQYKKQKPEQAMLLRWVYGKEREAKLAQERQRNPYYIISQNLMIDKDVFLAVNAPEIKRYGWDNVFSFQLYRQGITVHHIDNAVIHLGLEPCDSYLSKVQQAMSTLVWAEKNDMISENFTSIQKFYNSLKTFGLAGLLRISLTLWLPIMRAQLASKFPSVRVLDLYKFYYFSTYKYKA
jgi:glycosyltransferase involved in cell wall biosynthesis